MSRLTKLTTPIILIIIYLVFFWLFKTSNLTTSDIVSHATSIYSRYGYEIIFAGALMESLVIINLFVPGVTLVILGAVFARAGDIDLTLAVISAVSGAVLGFIVDFLMGYFGLGEIINKLGYGGAVRKARAEIERSSLRSFGLGFIHPNLGSFVSLSAGIIKMNFANFLVFATLSTLVWMSGWGILIFLTGQVFLSLLTKYSLLVVILVASLWLLLTLYGHRKSINN